MAHVHARQRLLDGAIHRGCGDLNFRRQFDIPLAVTCFSTETEVCTVGTSVDSPTAQALIPAVLQGQSEERPQLTILSMCYIDYPLHVPTVADKPSWLLVRNQAVHLRC